MSFSSFLPRRNNKKPVTVGNRDQRITAFIAVDGKLISIRQRHRFHIRQPVDLHRGGLFLRLHAAACQRQAQ